MALLEAGVGVDRLDEVLAVVEDALDGEVDDPGVVDGVHLGLLEWRHAIRRRQHHHPYPGLAEQRVLGSRPGVAGGGAEDRQMLAAAGQLVAEQLPQQLHRHVLERSRRSVAEMRQPHVIRKPSDGHNRRVQELLRGVGAVTDGTQVASGNVVGEQRTDLEGERRVTLPSEHLPPPGEGVRPHLRVFDGKVQATVRG